MLFGEKLAVYSIGFRRGIYQVTPGRSGSSPQASRWPEIHPRQLSTAVKGVRRLVMMLTCEKARAVSVFLYITRFQTEWAYVTKNMTYFSVLLQSCKLCNWTIKWQQCPKITKIGHCKCQVPDVAYIKCHWKIRWKRSVMSKNVMSVNGIIRPITIHWASIGLLLAYRRRR